MSSATTIGETKLSVLQNTIKQAQKYLLSKQSSDGYWCAELEANVTLTAEYVMLHCILGTVRTRPLQKIIKYLLNQQRESGGWELYFGDEGELSTTVEAYFALKLLGVSEKTSEMETARRFILERSGISKARIFTKLHLALFGAYDWKGIPSLPPWIMLLPKWSPFNIYEMASWARSSTVPLIIVYDKKPIWTVPNCLVDELYAEGRENADYAIPRDESLLTIGNLFVGFDSILKLTEQVGLTPLRAQSLKLAEQWTLDHQDETGDWAGIIPAMLNSILALYCLGYPLSHKAIKGGLEAIDRFGIETQEEFHIQPCVSPVWDTGLTIIALRDSGLPSNHSALVRAGEWLLSKQILREGDWKIKNQKGEPGGWAFEFYNDFYPDVDDTAVIVMALNYLSLPDEERKNKAIACAIKWVLSMQCKKGGWAAFDVDNDFDLLNQLPYGDLKAMIDPCTSDITARVLEMLGRTKHSVDSKVLERAISFLKKDQEPEDCWYGRWGVNYIYGTSGVINGLVAIGIDPREAFIMSAIHWLNSIQNEDGGWGETCKSYVDRNLMGQGKSTPSQTAWAILGLLAGGEGDSECAKRGIEYLIKMQNSDGSWPEDEFTGTGFPGYFYINYHFYRNYFPLMALGRYFTHSCKKQN